MVGPHSWALPSSSGKELVSLAAPEGRALGWVGGETARDWKPLARWVWRRLGCYVAGGVWGMG